MLEHWYITFVVLIVIFYSFLFDPYLETFIMKLKLNKVNILSGFGQFYGSGLPTLLLFLWFYSKRLTKNKNNYNNYAALLIIESYLFSGAIAVITKFFAGRWRPYTNQGVYSFFGFNVTNYDLFSYFSGHAAISFALSTVLAATTDNYLLKTIYYLFAIITCISRVYTAQHWFSDVLTGAIIGHFICRTLISLQKERLLLYSN
jgi:membrane-associated phospholipid phosphatase